jgi:Nidogen-like
VGSNFIRSMLKSIVSHRIIDYVTEKYPADQLQKTYAITNVCFFLIYLCVHYRTRLLAHSFANVTNRKIFNFFMQAFIDCGTSYYSVPWSTSSAILNLANASNVGLTGRWMYRVDGSTVVPARVTVKPGYTVTYFLTHDVNNALLALHPGN